MFVIDRIKKGSEDMPTETFQMAGTTGNVYSVVIDRVPTCTCPDNSLKRKQCKHIIYVGLAVIFLKVLVNVLKARADLQYQAAFLSSELREIYANAPPPPNAAATDSDDTSGNRKPIEGDCPICVLDFSPDKEEIVFCRAGCGNNIHAVCFRRWAQSKQGETVTCVYCRTPWREAMGKKISLAAATTNHEGYVNVAAELGLSGRRGMSSLVPSASARHLELTSTDLSTYHQPWVRRNYNGAY
ncbi:MAG: hypothetical protein M1832_000069 [Thelocarpon impressellum]|nr:MAG: hypothetical protein M1832_000069 [Thelocarpon impressellum]